MVDDFQSPNLTILTPDRPRFPRHWSTAWTRYHPGPPQNGWFFHELDDFKEAKILLFYHVFVELEDEQILVSLTNMSNLVEFSWNCYQHIWFYHQNSWNHSELDSTFFAQLRMPGDPFSDVCQASLFGESQNPMEYWKFCRAFAAPQRLSKAILLLPICSMYGIFIYIYHQNDPNVGKDSIHGASGLTQKP